MNPMIEVSEKTYEMLQQVAVPFVDKKPEDVIVRLLELTKAPILATSGERIYSGTAPNLSHTKVLSAKINGVAMMQPNWNRIMDRAINEAGKKLKDANAVSALVVVNHVVAQKTDHGYTHLSQTGISVQGQDANNAWKAASHIIKALGFSAEIVFAWLDNPKAANPGQIGKFVIAAA